jgi:hypothetical protein
MNWLVTPSTNWINLGWYNRDPSQSFAISGTLAPSQSANILVTIHKNANQLFPGYYTGSLTFVNMTNQTVMTTRSITLIVESASFTGTGSNTGSNP